MGFDGHDASKLEEALQVVDTRKFGRQRQIPKPVVVKADDPTKTDILDLNIKESCLATTTHLFDVVLDFEGVLNMDEITTCMRTNMYTSLPEPLCEKTRVDYGYCMQFNVGHTKENGKCDIVKWYLFDEKVHVNKVESALIYGKAYQPHWLSQAYTMIVKKVLYYMFERLAGTSFLYLCWADDDKRSKSLGDFDVGKRKQGYEFIRDKGPKSNNLRKLMGSRRLWLVSHLCINIYIYIYIYIFLVGGGFYIWVGLDGDPNFHLL